MDAYGPFKNRRLIGPFQRRRLLIFLLLSIMLIWGIVKLIDNLWIASEKQQYINQLEQQKQIEQEKKKNYELQITNLQNEEYIEQQARENFNMTRPEDTTFSVPE